MSKMFDFRGKDIFVHQIIISLSLSIDEEAELTRSNTGLNCNEHVIES